MFRFFVAAAALLTSWGAAQAADQRTMEVLSNTNIETIRPVLRNAGMRPETMDIEGRPALAVRDSGDRVILRPRVCNPDCTGLLMFVVLDGAAPANAINSYNQQTPATVAYTNGRSTILSRYLIADHGITEGTFLVNLDVFKQTVRKWTQNRNGQNAMSVSLMSRSTIGDYDPDTEALIREIESRPELISGRIVNDY